MICNQKYLNKITLDTVSDVNEFVRIASKCDGKVTVVSGNRRISAKSILGLHFARIAWDELWLESDHDYSFEFRRFIAD